MKSVYENLFCVLVMIGEQCDKLMHQWGVLIQNILLCSTIFENIFQGLLSLTHAVHVTPTASSITLCQNLNLFLTGSTSVLQIFLHIRFHIIFRIIIILTFWFTKWRAPHECYSYSSLFWTLGVSNTVQIFSNYIQIIESFTISFTVSFSEISKSCHFGSKCVTNY